jgi:hypothetical protein
MRWYIVTLVFVCTVISSSSASANLECNFARAPRGIGETRERHHFILRCWETVAAGYYPLEFDYRILDSDGGILNSGHGQVRSFSPFEWHVYLPTSYQSYSGIIEVFNIRCLPNPLLGPPLWNCHSPTASFPW